MHYWGKARKSKVVIVKFILKKKNPHDQLETSIFVVIYIHECKWWDGLRESVH